MNYKLFDSREQAADYFASYFDDIVKSKNGEKVSIALSGGNSPKWYLPALIEVKDIDWSKIFFYQVDERCVPFDDAQNNYKMLKETLFDKVNIPEGNLCRINGSDDAVSGTEQYGDILLKNKVKFDLVVLGMGNDGHTASIFPERDYLYSYKNVTGIYKFPSSEQKRITLTEDVINSAANKIFMVEGEDKEEVLKHIFFDRNKSVYPAARITGNVMWALNKNSAGFLIS